MKHIFAHGVKGTAGFVPNGYFGTLDGTGANVATKTGSVYTSTNYDVDPAQLASIGLITTAPGTLTFSCTRSALHATSNALTAGTAIALPTGTATTFTVTGSGNACSTSTTSKSGAISTGLVSATVLASMVALLAFEF